MSLNPQPRPRMRLWRDVLSVALLTVGSIGLVVLCFAVDPLAGWALVCAATVGIGAAIGYERE